MLKLSDSSKSNVTKIQNVVQNVIDSVKNLSMHSNSMLEFIETDIDKDYKSILETVNQYSKDTKIINDIITDFSANSEEILASVQSMLTEINTISLAANEGSNGTANIVQKLSVLIEKSSQVDSEVEVLKDDIVQLNSIISKFKV